MNGGTTLAPETDAVAIMDINLDRSSNPGRKLIDICLKILDINVYLFSPGITPVSESAVIKSLTFWKSYFCNFNLIGAGSYSAIDDARFQSAGPLAIPKNADRI